MAAPTYADALAVSTEAELLAFSLASAESQGVDVAGWDDFAPQRAIFSTDVRAIYEEQKIRAQIAMCTDLATAAGAGAGFFDQALSWYDLDNGYGGKGRIPAVATVWTLRVSCLGTSGPYTIPTSPGYLIAQANDGTFFQSTNNSPIDLPAGGTVNVQFTCLTAGTIGNQTPGAIVHLAVKQPGMGVTNASPAARTTVGRDIETPAEAIVRAIGKWGTIGAGWTRPSFDYLIPLFAPTVTRWRVRDDNPDGPGTIRVIAGNAAGPSTSGENAAILAGLSAPDVMTLGTGGLAVVSASSALVTVTGTLYGDGTNPTLLTDAKAALDILAAKFPIGGDQDGYLRLDLITAILMGGAWPESAPLTIADLSGAKVYIAIPGFKGAKHVDLAAPAGDTSVALAEIVGFDYTGLVLG